MKFVNKIFTVFYFQGNIIRNDVFQMTLKMVETAKNNNILDTY